MRFIPTQCSGAISPIECGAVHAVWDKKAVYPREELIY